MNKELLQQIKRLILEDPRKLMMSYFHCQFSPKATQRWPDEIPPCGTVACIAGWAVLLIDKEPVENKWAERAQKILGLTNKQAESIFFVSNWPEKYRDDWIGTDSINARARITADYIDHLCSQESA